MIQNYCGSIVDESIFVLKYFARYLQTKFNLFQIGQGTAQVPQPSLNVKIITHILIQPENDETLISMLQKLFLRICPLDEQSWTRLSSPQPRAEGDEGHCAARQSSYTERYPAAGRLLRAEHLVYGAPRRWTAQA